MLTAYRIARGGYLAHIDDDERRVLAGLVKDAVYLLGSDVEHEAERRSQTVDPDDPLAELEADVVDIADAIAAVPSITLTSRAAPRFVEFVENGITTGPELLEVAEEYLAPIKDAGVDTLILGCTHYPILAGVISYVMGNDVALVSSAQETARDVYRELTARDLLRDPQSPAPTHTFQSTGDAHEFQTLARRFLGPEVASVHQLKGKAS